MRIQKEIENVERVKDKIATMPLTMEDAIEFHKQVVDRVEKERKEINKELDLDSDIEEKGFTGASKEPKKVSTPELKKMKLSESLFESISAKNEAFTFPNFIFKNNIAPIISDAGTTCQMDAADIDVSYYKANVIYLLNTSKKEADRFFNYLENKGIQCWNFRPIKGYSASFDVPKLKELKLSESLNENLQDDLINDVYNKLGDLAFEYYEEKNENPTKEEWQRALDWFMEKFFDESNYLDYELEDDEFDESLNESFIKNEKQLAKYIADNFEEITGLNVKDIYNTESDEEIFNQDYVDITYPKIKQFIYDFNEDNDTNFDEEDILYLLDDELSSYKYFNESLNECDKFKKGDCKNYALDEAKISRQNQRRKKDAYLQRKEAEREKAEKEARERERIGDAAWGEKDWIAEREKGDLDFSNYSDEEKAEIEKRLKAFDDNKTAQAQYQRRKEAEEAKRAEEERKKAEQEKEERTKKKIERIGKLANAPKDIGNAFKKGLGIG